MPNGQKLPRATATNGAPHLQRDFSRWIDATRDPSELRLGFEGFRYEDLFAPEKLAELSKIFERELETTDLAAFTALVELRTKAADAKGPQAVSDALLAVAPHVSSFVAKLFRVEEETRSIREEVEGRRLLWDFKREFVKKRIFKPNASRAFLGRANSSTDPAKLAASVAMRALAAMGAPESLLGTGSAEEETAVAAATLRIHEVDDTGRKAAKAGGAHWTDDLHARAAAMRSALKAASLGPDVDKVVAVAGAQPTDAEDVEVSGFAMDAVEAWLAARRQEHTDPAHKWPTLKAPHNIDAMQLVKLRRPDEKLPELFVGPEGESRARDGFALTDRRMGPRGIEQEVDYCLLCHDRDKDSCSKGLREPKSTAIKKNPLGVSLAGCPLEEKISEMHTMRAKGDVIASLALVCIDNPMLPGTGHRICNDCMKACVFQKQEPVNIPEVETSVLSDVLNLPWGFEIYGFLTRWNPLNIARPHARPYNGKNVLVVGLGPAGYTLSHHLTQEGFAVAAADGLKIEPLPVELTGDATRSPRPIKDYKMLYEELDERVLLGFGGVSEYGITVRWDKNFLSVLYITLARQKLLRIFGGVRFGGSITLEDAWSYGFDHVAIAAGAGRPTLIKLKNNLARGIRKASDFLMALQLTGAYKRSALANLQVRLPAVVIGGGLTAIDTATELIAYYPIQAEKTAERIETLIRERGEKAIVEMFDAEERSFIAEQLGHAAQIREERAKAKAEGRTPNFQPLIDTWGGVSIVYRKRVLDSPAYRLNHEEVAKSLEEGVRYIENLSPIEAVLDEESAVKSMKFTRQVLGDDGKWVESAEVVELPARTVCVAAGTQPNVTYEREYPHSFKFDKWNQYFQPHKAYVDDAGKLHVEQVDDAREGFFTSYDDGRHTVSFYGDNHPHYAGSVVKAMASAKDAYPSVRELFRLDLARLDETPQASRDAQLAAFFTKIDDDMTATVHAVNRLTPTIIEVVVRAPAAARKFHPGQFYRLQNFEAFSPLVEDTAREVFGADATTTRLAMEGIALTGAWVDKEKGLLSLIALEMGTSTRLLSTLTVGERVIVMGPTGTPTEIPERETVLLAGGGLGNAVLFSIAKALKSRGARVVYFAGYRKGEDLFKQDDIEVATDQVVWCTDSGNEIGPRRDQDRHFRGNIVQAMTAYAKGQLGGEVAKLSEVSRIIAIGSDRMMKAVREARHGVLQAYLNPRHVGLGSINSPMQCMMKEVCAQCLQRHVDPETGKETFVFTCYNQDQELDRVDFDNLNARLKQSSVQEKVSNGYLDYLFGLAPDLRKV
ncbi:MAG: FAD-dependent oxidoreductase [Polyangiaceae bacterium]|nr:FAD-dependent oxidoreductase [Polyangiaceae bacterium]